MCCSGRNKAMSKTYLPYTLILTLFLSSCDILNMSALEIVAWSPGKEVVQSFNNIEIGLTFSSPVDTLAAEAAFSLRKDGGAVTGTFSWSQDDKKLKFTTWEPLDPDYIYELSVESSVEDINGNSLREKFVRKFGTFSDIERPTVISISPDVDEVTDDVRHPISLTFSEAISTDSWFEAFSISPSVEGAVSWSPDRTVFELSPAVDLTPQQEYTARISTQLRDLAGNRIGKEFVSRFKVGSDTTAPELLRVTDAATGSKDLVADDPTDGAITLNTGWATTDTVLLVFSKPIDTYQVSSFVTLSPPNHFKITDTTRYQNEVELSFEARFVHGVTYTLSVDGRLEDTARNKLGDDRKYHIVFDDPATTPPTVDVEAGIAFSSTFVAGNPSGLVQLTPGSQFDRGDFPVATTNMAYFDFLVTVADADISTASGAAAILRNSFLSSLDISVSNSAASFDVLGGYVNPPSAADDGTFTDDEDPLWELGQDEVVIRVYVLFTPQAKFGVMTISIAEGLDDGTGNVSTQTFTAQYNYL